VTEAELILKCQQQHPASQKILYDRYAGKMLSVCMRYINDKDEAEDILQEGFIKIFAHISHFRNEGSLEGWMRRIFVNTALSVLRSKQIKFTESIDNHAVKHQVEPSVFDKISSQEIFEMIRTLPNGYRVVFNLFAIEGYSHKEIADMLNITESTSRTQFLKARNALKEKFLCKQIIKVTNE
jgi:RNA polymerase sigma-70 factor (ECF subfamily)